MKKFTVHGSQFTVNGRFLVKVLFVLVAFSSCTKTININLPDSAQQVVVDGSIENGVPPVINLTKSQKFFGNINVNNLGSYFIHGASIHITASDSSKTDLVEFCFKDLNLSPAQAKLILNGFGLGNLDTALIPDVCVYTVPDIINYFTNNKTAFMGKERTSYHLDIISPPLYGADSFHVSASTYIPSVISLDSVSIHQHPNPDYRDSMVALYANLAVPDTFGNFVRYKTKRNDESYYTPLRGSVYDDKLFIGLHIGLPIERGQPSNAEFDINTDSYFWKGDTVTVKWSNIDYNTYQFFYTLEHDGGDSPFSQPVRIKSNISNGLGVWAGYATRYYTIIIPKQ